LDDVRDLVGQNQVQVISHQWTKDDVLANGERLRTEPCIGSVGFPPAMHPNCAEIQSQRRLRSRPKARVESFALVSLVIALCTRQPGFACRARDVELIGSGCQQLFRRCIRFPLARIVAANLLRGASRCRSAEYRSNGPVADFAVQREDSIRSRTVAAEGPSSHRLPCDVCATFSPTLG
jgi:hypothetical protein